jgi:hypothetical protein
MCSKYICWYTYVGIINASDLYEFLAFIKSIILKKLMPSLNIK